MFELTSPHPNPDPALPYPTPTLPLGFVGACAMFGSSELTSVAFAYGDPDQTAYLTKQRFFRLVAHLMEVPTFVFSTVQ